MEYIIEKIRGLQDLKKVSTKEFSKSIGVTPQTIYDYYSGKTQLSINNLKKIADFFGVPVGYFFEESGSEKIIQTGNGVAQVGLNNNNNAESGELSACRKEVESLKKEIELKDKIIQLLEKGN